MRTGLVALALVAALVGCSKPAPSIMEQTIRDNVPLTTDCAQLQRLRDIATSRGWIETDYQINERRATLGC